MFTQPFIRAQIKENSKAPRHWPLCGEFIGDQWIPRINGQKRGKCFHSMTSSCITLRSEHSGRHLATFWNKISWVKIMVILFKVCSKRLFENIFLSRFQHLGHWHQIHYLNQWWQKMHCAKSGGKVHDCSLEENRQNTFHDDVIKWKHLPRYRSP